MKSFGNIVFVLASCASSSKLLTPVGMAPFSELPFVPTMRPIQSVMEGFTHERDRLDQEAAVLGLHLNRLEKADADRIAQQDKVDLEKLKEQQKKNQVVAVENAKLAKEVMDVRKVNDVYSGRIQNEQKLIKLRRNQLGTFKKQFLEGQERVNNLLGRDPELALLQMGDETRREEDEQEEEEKEEKHPTSFLETPTHEQVANAAMSMPDATAPRESTEITSLELEAAAGFGDQAQKPVVEAATQSFGSGQTGLTELDSETGAQISSLSKQASKLSKATHHSLAELKASSEQAYKALANYHTALMQQQSALKASVKSVEERYVELIATYKRVTGVRQGLEQELQKNGALLGEVQKMEAIQVSSHSE